MPRTARVKSETGIYHIILRGINRQIIFEDIEDREVLLNILLTYKRKCDFKVYAYCLMNNHMHLLLEESKTEVIGMIMKKICSTYVLWYNKKYDRIGHLFQDRFKSEPVDSNDYLLTVIRYIHQNPLISGIVDNIKEYKFSSFTEYLDKEILVDSAFILSLFGSDSKSPIGDFIDFNSELNDKICLEYDRNKRFTDKEAANIILAICKVSSTKNIQTFNKKDRNDNLSKLRKMNISIRQLERLTGISRGVIQGL